MKFRVQAFTLVFYFSIVFPKWFTGIGRCSIGTHLRGGSALSISQRKDETIKPAYFPVEAGFDRASGAAPQLSVLGFAMSFSLVSCFLFFDLSALRPGDTDVLCFAPAPSQGEADRQRSDCRLRELKTLLSALPVERELATQASFNRCILPEGEKQVRQFLMSQLGWIHSEMTTSRVLFPLDLF